jgi:starch phosphorylase
MRESMAQLTPRFSTNRSVREYTEQHYLPAASAYRERAADNGAGGRNIVRWQQTLRERWASLRFGYVKVETRGAQYVFEVELFLNDLDPEAVRVELYADGLMGRAPERHEMARTRRLDGVSGRYIYSAVTPGARPHADYTARLIPHYDGVAVPLEVDPILWQR